MRLPQQTALVFATLLAAGFPALHAQETIPIEKTTWMFGEKPMPIAISGFSGETDQVLKFDLEVMGFKLASLDSAQYLLTGSNDGHVEGRLMDAISKAQSLGKAYTGGSLRQQTHALANDVMMAVRHTKGIAGTRIAFKVQQSANDEIYVADFDGYDARPVTSDHALVTAPAWVPGRLALYYTSYKLGKPDVFYHDLSSGSRKVIAQYGGSNLSPAPSPDGRHVAMVLSKDGWTDLYVANADGTGLKRLTRSREDESSPCWSPDSQWICFATKINERRVLAKVPAGGGEVQRISTSGVSNPTEPDWSPDGKWIAFTRQGGGFDICVVDAKGGTATVLAPGEDPSWAPNSRNLVFCRRQGGNYVLSLLDVPTKQVKDVHRISGSCSEPSWAR